MEDLSFFQLSGLLSYQRPKLSWTKKYYDTSCIQEVKTLKPILPQYKEKEGRRKNSSLSSIVLVGQVLAWKQCLTDRTPSLFIIIFTSVCISYFQWPLVNLGLVSKLYTIPSTINTWLIWHMKWGLECIRRINHGLFSLLFNFFFVENAF